MKIPFWLVGAVLPPFFRLWCKTLRITEIGRELPESMAQGEQPFVLCLWHDEFFPLISVRRHLKLGVIVSQSDDGEYVTRVLRACGFYTPRGSSSRGGAAVLVRAVKLMREEGVSICITVDGPRGPRHRVKNGAIVLARKTNAPVIAARAYMERAKIFHRAWDKFQLPLPFSKVTLVYSKPWYPADGDLSPEHLRGECAVLERMLNDLHIPDREREQ